MNNPKGHHFLPQFYLKGFTFLPHEEDPPVWVHERDKESKPLTVSQIAKQTHFYSTRKKVGGQPDTKGESTLGEIEGYMAPVLRKVISNEGASELTDEECLTFAAFVGLMSLRTPQNFRIADIQFKDFQADTVKKYMETITDEEIREIYDKTVSEHPEVADVPFEDAKEFLLSQKLDPQRMELAHSAGIYDMWVSLPQIIPFILKMDWNFWIPDDNRRFVTTDDPVVSTIRTGRGITFVKGGWIHRSLEVHFPLTPRLCFAATKGGGTGTTILTGDSVPLINEMLIMMSQRFVYSSRKSVPEIQGAINKRDRAAGLNPKPFRISEVH